MEAPPRTNLKLPETPRVFPPPVPATALSELSIAHPTLSMLFKIERIEKIHIRTNTGIHLKSPLILTADNLADLLPCSPNTEDEHLVAYVAENLHDAITAFRKSSHYRHRNFFADLSHVLTKTSERYHWGKDHVVREVIYTWLAPPYVERPMERAVVDDLSPEQVRDLIERWKRKEPGTFPE
ncbi:MAG: hypothetical protein NUV54_00140 [Candidatus Taylorbacteria bacterium]|nr:hypothetical protein [Candidatus Taylorbacteria bacterium]